MGIVDFLDDGYLCCPKLPVADRLKSAMDLVFGLGGLGGAYVFASADVCPWSAT